MNHWLQQATAASPAKRQPKTPEATRQYAHKRSHPAKSKKLERLRVLVQRQPVNSWFNAADVMEDTFSSVDYVRDLLKGMAERGELVSEFRRELSEHRDRTAQHMHKWMFKREN